MEKQPQPRAQGEAEPETGFDAFISYSREDVEFARALEKALEKFRPPKGLGVARRRLRVFRDEQDLVGTELGEALAAFLARSRKLVLICSPAARRSQYVDDEIGVFTGGRSPRDIVPVLFRGRPNSEFEPGQEDDRAFPKALEKIGKEPLATDYRGFDPARDKPHQSHHRNAWYMLLANLLDVERNDLERRDFRRQRRERALIVTLTALVVTSLATFGAIAWVQKNRADEQRDIALTGLAVNLAVKSRSLMGNSADMGLLVATEAADLTAASGRPAVPEARQALRDALAVTSGELLATLADEVVTIGFDAAAEHAYAVEGERIRSWRLASGEPSEGPLFEPPVAAGVGSPPTAVSANGRWLAAVSAETTWVVDLAASEPAPSRLEGPGEEVASLAIGDGGRWLAAVAESGTLWARHLAGAGSWETVTALPAAESEDRPAAVEPWISADESVLYLSDATRTLRFWSLGDGVVSGLGSVEDFPLYRGRVAVGPGGEPIALAGWREPLVLHSFDVDRPAPVLGGDPVSPEWVQFSPDGRWLVAVDDERSLLRWDVNELAEPPAVLEAEAAPHSPELAFSSDSRYLAVASRDGLVQVWELERPEWGSEVRGRHRPPVATLAFSPDGRRLLSVGRASTALLADLEEDSDAPPVELRLLSGIDQAVLSPDSRWLLTRGGGALRLTSLASPHAGSRIVRGVVEDPEITEERSHRSPGVDSLSVVSATPYGRLGSAAAFSGDGRWLATLGEGGEALLVDLADLRRPPRRLAGLEEVTAVAFDPTSRWLVAGGKERELRVWKIGDLEAEPLRLRRVESDGESSLARLAFSPDGRWLAAGAGLGEAEIWSWPAGAASAEAVAAAEPIGLGGHRGWVLGVEFARDGALLATVGERAAQVWSLEDLTEPRARFEIPLGYSAAALVPGRRRLVTGGVDGIARIWNVDLPGEPPIELRGHASEILNLAVDPPGEQLATVSEDSVMLWHLEGAQSAPLRELEHRGAVAAAFSSPSELITAGYGEIEIWNLAARSEPPIRLSAHERPPVWLGIAPGSDSMATVGTDGTARTWPLGTDRLIRLACEIVNGNLEYQIWRDAFGDRPYETTCPELPPHPSLLAAGREAAEEGDFERAVELLRRAVELDDDLDLEPEREAREVAVRAMLERGKRLAREGKTNAASVQFERARALDRDAAPEPLEMANRYAAAQVHLAEGRDLAREGRVEAAVARFITARGVDPEVEVDPGAEAGKLAAPRTVERARSAAREGKIEEAIELYRQALELDPALATDPRAEASRYAAIGHRQAAERLAEDGRVDEAVERFEAAVELDPRLEIDPRAEALRLAAPRLAREGLGAVREGRVAEGLARIRQAREADLELEITADCWAQLCWHGALWGEAALVSPACDAALELDPENGGSRDSRGVVRALLGDFAGAKADFEAYVRWAPENRRGEELIALRRGWIASLDAGRNPMTEAQLAELREAERGSIWLGSCTRRAAR